MTSLIKGLTKRLLPTVAVATLRRTLLELDKLRTKRIFAYALQTAQFGATIQGERDVRIIYL